ncbi:MAG TPA: ABC transporter ATP-binding protein [Gemmatimonadaceae bacterium]|nr:ABC transporter ATP-binding protein [Gemmatimonadaceae bacterium]
MIEIAGLRKRYKSLQVLDGVDLTIGRGRVTAVVGPNAAGKTTLIKTILGLARADAGTISIGGVEIDDRGEYRAGIGYMPQIARFPDNITGQDLIDMIVDLRGTPPASTALVDLLDLQPHLVKPLRVLSGGTRQKINAVIAFLFAPPVLILDEPTAGLDPVSAGVLKDQLKAERERGTTVVLTSHVLSEIDELADDVAFLSEGRIRFSGAVHDLKRVTRQFTLERAIAHVLQHGVAA